MKYLSLIVASLAALASAAPTSLQPRGYCAPLSYGTCTPGVHKFGSYNYRKHCGQKVDLKKSSYVPESNHRGLSYDACVLGCSNDSICCAVNYDECNAICHFLIRSDGTDHCYASPVYYSPAPGYDGANNVPPKDA